MSDFPYGPSALVGRVIHSVMQTAADSLTFMVDDALPVVWGVEGDCCSQSEFTDVRLGAILGKPITAVEVIEAMTDERLNPATLSLQEKRQEEEQIYGVEIRAGDAKGLVVHRNWSNGYYGGSLRETGRRMTRPAPPQEGET